MTNHTSVFWLCVYAPMKRRLTQVRTNTPKGFLMFTHSVLSREVLEHDVWKLKLSSGAHKPPRPANLCSTALHSALSQCVFLSLYGSPLISWVYWVMIAHRHPVTEDVTWLSGVQEAPAESTVFAVKHTHMRSISALFVSIHRKAIKI